MKYQYTNPDAAGCLLEAEACTQVMKELERLAEKYKRQIDRQMGKRRKDLVAAMEYGRAEIVTQLISLENQQNRLEYYVSLLKPRYTELLGLLYFEERSQEECAAIMKIAPRTVRRIKEDAINELTELYCFTEGFTSGGCPEPDRKNAE